MASSAYQNMFPWVNPPATTKGTPIKLSSPQPGSPRLQQHKHVPSNPQTLPHHLLSLPGKDLPHVAISSWQWHRRSLMLHHLTLFVPFTTAHVACLCPLLVLQKKILDSIALLPLPYRTRATCRNSPPKTLKARQDSSVTVKDDPTQTSSLAIHDINSQQDSMATTQSHTISLDLYAPDPDLLQQRSRTQDRLLVSTLPVKNNLHHSGGRTLSWLVQHRSGPADRSTDAEGACNQCR